MSKYKHERVPLGAQIKEIGDEARLKMAVLAFNASLDVAERRRALERDIESMKSSLRGAELHGPAEFLEPLDEETIRMAEEDFGPLPGNRHNPDL